jgi:DNA polymerase-3 subunit gamma/tau
VADTSGRALYLVWRPRRFDDVVGQPHIVQTIRNAVRNGTIAHAYLFSGPRGTGKTTMARLLFKAVNCLRPDDGAPCEQCAICISANDGRALDLIEMDAASNRGIDDVRELRDKINYAPADARYRVYILDEAHQLTQAAWDALLKTLEEPPPHAILVLATTEAHKVPATVLSRCQRFDFHRHTAANIRNQLSKIAHDEGIQVEGAVLSWLARAARGGMRDAISLLDQLRTFCGDTIDADSARDVLGLAGLIVVQPFLAALQEERPGDALEALNEALDRGTDLRVYIADTLTYLRALMLLRYGAVTPLRAELPDDELEWLEASATAWEAGRLRQLVGGFGDALARLRDPAQLLVQVELVVLGGVPTAERSSSAAPVAREVPVPPALPFTPARAAKAPPTPQPPPIPQHGAPPLRGIPVSHAGEGEPALTPDLSQREREQRPSPAHGRGDEGPHGRAAPESSELRGRRDGGAGGGGFSRPDDEPRPEPEAFFPPDDETSYEAPPMRPEATPVTPAATGDEPPSSKWDGLGPGGGTVRAHWETDEDDDTEIVRVVVEAPPPPPPPARKPTNGTATTTPPEPAEPAAPDFDFEELRQRWPALRDEIWSHPIDRASFHSCELVGVEGARLVIQMSSGNLRLLKDEKKRAIRGELVRLLGKGADVRFIDDKMPYTPPSSAAAAATGATATPPLPTNDPVIQAGLRFFGGPLERLPDD